MLCTCGCRHSGVKAKFNAKGQVKNFDPSSGVEVQSIGVTPLCLTGKGLPTLFCHVYILRAASYF